MAGLQLDRDLLPIVLHFRVRRGSTSLEDEPANASSKRLLNYLRSRITVVVPPGSSTELGRRVGGCLLGVECQIRCVSQRALSPLIRTLARVTPCSEIPNQPRQLTIRQHILLHIPIRRYWFTGSPVWQSNSLPLQLYYQS